MEDMMKSKKKSGRSLKAIKVICLVLIIAAIYFVGNYYNKFSDNKKQLVGFWNIEFENSQWVRCCDYDLLDAIMYIGRNDSVNFPMVRDTTDQIDYGGKNYLELEDSFFTEEIMEKGGKRWRKMVQSASGIWRFTSKKGDSVLFYAPNSPFHGKYAVRFFTDSVPVYNGRPNNVKYVYKMELINDSTYLLCNKGGEIIW